MEVPGRQKDPYLEKGSEEDVFETCLPCEVDGKHIPADGFCESCDHYLCTDCFRAHTVPLPCKNHRLLDAKEMPRGKRLKPPKVTIEKQCTSKCPDHEGKITEFFCPVHDSVICGVCAVVNHRACKVDYIPDIAEGYKDSAEFKDLIESFGKLLTDVTVLKTAVAENISAETKSSESVVCEIRQYKGKVISFLDGKEDELILSTKQMLENDTSSLQKLDDELHILKTKITDSMEQLTSKNIEISDLFVTGKNLAKEYSLLQQASTRCSDRNRCEQYMFKPDQAMTDLISLDERLGHVERHTQERAKAVPKSHSQKSIPEFVGSSLKITRLHDINVRVSSDKKSCWITGMAIHSSNTILLADKNNNNVKLLDTYSLTVTSRLSLSDKPWDITTLPNYQAAVTMAEAHKINIFSTRDGLKTVRTIKVDSECRGISTANYKLVVSCKNPGRVLVMDLQGKVSLTISTDKSGDKLFVIPDYVVVVEEDRMPVIYVTDFLKDTITKLSFEGQVLYTYLSKNFKGLTGLTSIGYRQLMVCSYSNKSVIEVSEAGKKNVALPDNFENLASQEHPRTMCYSMSQNALYYSRDMNRDTIKVYTFIVK